MKSLDLAAGAVAVRRGRDEWIATFTGGRWTHAGIVFSPDLIIDANDTPKTTRRRNAIAKVPSHDFFMRRNAPGGGAAHIYEGDPEEAGMAAEWALDRAQGPAKFDIFTDCLSSTMTHGFSGRFYCSLFVYHAYLYGADIRLVDLKQCTNLSQRHGSIEKAIRAVVKAWRSENSKRQAVPALVARFLVRAWLGQHSGVYITPDDLLQSAKLRRLWVTEPSFGGAA